MLDTGTKQHCVARFVMRKKGVVAPHLWADIVEHGNCIIEGVGINLIKVHEAGSDREGWVLTGAPRLLMSPAHRHGPPISKSCQ